MRIWGMSLVTYRLLVAVSVGSIFAMISYAGLPQIRVEEGDHKQWSPSGGKVEQQLTWVDEYMDETVTDRRSMWIMLSATDGSNLLENPAFYLEKLELLLRTMRAETRVRLVDDWDVEHSLGWDDVCLSIDHPLINALAPGRKPCINPSPLDAFAEQVRSSRARLSIPFHSLRSPSPTLAGLF